MKEPKRTYIRQRFIIAYTLVGASAFLAVVGVAAGLRGQLPKLPSGSHVSESPACVSVGCAKLGDDATYVLHGKVTSIQSPQAGVVCVQVQSSKSAGDYCGYTK